LSRGLAVVAFAFALIVCAGCANNRLTAKAPAPAAPPIDPATQMEALEERIFEIVQDERHKINPQAKPLALDSELLGVARRRSADMAANKYVAHKGRNGETSASLIMDEDQDFQGLLGENLASQQFIRQSNLDVEACARRFVDTWLGSPKNKENLALSSYDRSGVGAAVAGDTIYVTELFAAEMGSPPGARNAGTRSSGATPSSAPPQAARP
jgi:uncharacterized protein YkwD